MVTHIVLSTAASYQQPDDDRLTRRAWALMPRPVRLEKNKINSNLIQQFLAFCCWTEIIFQKHRHAIDKNSPSPLSCIDRLWTCAMLPEQIPEQISPRNPQIFCQNPKSSQESSSSTIGQGEVIYTEGSFFSHQICFLLSVDTGKELRVVKFLFSWLCCLWYSTAGVVADGVCVEWSWCLCWCWWS